ncbi:MAG: hypothetical protein J1F64_03870 [Oscillospiraceae bacterium]|nr:hypothetical protein [Oscillospiraceae bacterium]
MAISGIGNNCNVYGYASVKKETAKAAAEKTAQAENTKASGDKTAEYYAYLSEKYDCVRTGSVGISGSYLRRCANDPEKAKELEENLSLFKDIYESGYNSAKRNAAALGAKLTHYSHSWSIDGNGEITMISSTTVVTENGTKSAKEVTEELQKRLKEKKEELKKAEKAKAEKEEERERSEKTREKNDAAESPDEPYYPMLDVSI